MSQFTASSGGRRPGAASSGGWRPQTADALYGEESSLPLLQCPYCKRARVIERRTQQDSQANYGRIYIKCPRNERWIPDKCDYCRWQRAYFQELIDGKVIQVFHEYGGEQEEVEHAGRAGGATNMQKHPMEAKLDKLMNALVFLTILVVGFMGVGLGYMLKQ